MRSSTRNTLVAHLRWMMLRTLHNRRFLPASQGIGPSLIWNEKPSTCNIFTVIPLSLLVPSNLLRLSSIHNKATASVNVQISCQKAGSPTHNGVALWVFLFIISFLTSVRKSCIRSMLQPSCWVKSRSMNASTPSNMFIIINLSNSFILPLWRNGVAHVQSLESSVPPSHRREQSRYLSAISVPKAESLSCP
jgi:hypothetical protein